MTKTLAPSRPAHTHERHSIGTRPIHTRIIRRLLFLRTTATAAVRLDAASIVEYQDMNEDRIKGQWKQLQGKLKARWGKLTDDDLKVAEGSSEYLAGKLQERYGIARDEAMKQLKEFDESGR